MSTHQTLHDASLHRPAVRPLRPPSTAPLLLGAALFGAGSLGCDSGARVRATGEDDSIGGGAQFLDVDFELRRDLFLTDGFMGDGLSGFLGDMRAADLDGDGDVDLVQTNFADHDFTIAYGTGNGEFPIRETFGVRGAPLRVELGDFDGDGDLDVAVAVKAQEIDVDQPGDPEDGVHVFTQASDGSFGEAAYRALPSNPFGMTAAPVSGGPADELLVTLPYEHTTLWLALVGGSLELVEDLPSFAAGAFGKPLSVCVVDLSGDGLPEVVVGDDSVENAVGGRVLVHHNLPDGDAGFLAPGAAFGDGEPEVLEFAGLPAMATPLVTKLGDVNGDGVPDLGIADFNGRHLNVFSRDASLVFQFQSVDFGAQTLSFLAEDFDGDGLVDLGATLVDEGAVALKRALGDGEYGPATHLSVGYLPRALQAAEVDGDGRLDLLTCNAQDLSLLRGQPGPRYKSAHGYRAYDEEEAADGWSEVEPALVEAADLDGDGNADVITLDQRQRQVVFLRGDGTGALEYAGATPLTPNSLETPGFALLRDFDADGDVDLVTSLLRTDELAFLRNDGALPFSVTNRYPVGDAPRGIAAGDVDGDGNLDLVVANHGDSTLQVCLGDGTGAFEPQEPFAVAAPPLSVALFDADGDGDADCAVGTGSGGPAEAFLLVLEGDGTGHFEPAVQHALGAQAQTLVCADLDGDSDGDALCDIVASQAGEIADEVFVFRNGSSEETGLSFSSQALTIGLDPGSVIVADADRDGNLDLIVPLGRGEVRVARGDGTGQFPDTDVLPPDLRALSSPFGTIDSAWHDLDGDGLEDLILVSHRTPHVWVARNTSVPVPVDE